MTRGDSVKRSGSIVSLSSSAKRRQLGVVKVEGYRR